MARCDQDVPEAAELVDLEPAGSGAHPAHAVRSEALVPAGALAQLRDMPEKVVDGRAVPVAHRLDERSRRASAQRLARGEARERARVAVAVALGPHALLAYRLGARAPGRHGVRIGAEDGDLGGLEASVSQGQIRDEARQTAADDRA
jgi:hypothetical protein